MGSSDRRFISAVVYAYYRIGRSVPVDAFHDRLIAALVIFGELRSKSGFELLEQLHPGISGKLPQSDSDKKQLMELVSAIVKNFDFNRIFDFQLQLSNGIDPVIYGNSMLEQPRVFLRVRKNYSNSISKEFNLKSIKFSVDQLHEHIWSVDSGTDLVNTESYNKGFFEIQDRSSQLAADQADLTDLNSMWDCCCGAGGKSLFLADKFPKIKIVSSDTRPSIIKNFKTRIRRSEITSIQTQELDATNSIPSISESASFDAVIADVPCTGSGTWSRHPENLVLFQESALEQFTDLQRKLLQNISQNAHTGQQLFYITCSVFYDENEKNIEYCTQQLGYQLNAKSLISGINEHSDTMFFADLTKM